MKEAQRPLNPFHPSADLNDGVTTGGVDVTRVGKVEDNPFKPAQDQPLHGLIEFSSISQTEVPRHHDRTNLIPFFENFEIHVCSSPNE